MLLGEGPCAILRAEPINLCGGSPVARALLSRLVTGSIMTVPQVVSVCRNCNDRTPSIRAYVSAKFKAGLGSFGALYANISIVTRCRRKLLGVAAPCPVACIEGFADRIYCYLAGALKQTPVSAVAYTANFRRVRTTKKDGGRGGSEKKNTHTPTQN